MRAPIAIASLLVLLWYPCLARALSPMDDSDLADVSGSGGVQLSLTLRNNLDKTGNPINCSGLLSDCRMGFEFSGRSGIWLMLKDYYGVLSVSDIKMEGGSLPGTNTGYQDSTRFYSLTGDCLAITSGSQCDPRGAHALIVSYPNNKAAGDYRDITLLMNIGRTALEFDDSVSGLVHANPDGYMHDDATGSVLGYRMADSSALNAPARARFDGVSYVFGF